MGSLRKTWVSTQWFPRLFHQHSAQPSRRTGYLITALVTSSPTIETLGGEKLYVLGDDSPKKKKTLHCVHMYVYSSLQTLQSNTLVMSVPHDVSCLVSANLSPGGSMVGVSCAETV